MSINDFFYLIGGLALFLFGMNVMSHALEAIAGGQLKSILGKLTSNPFKGFLLGTGVTVIIQSSSATTVMVVGFVNSGLMTLSQSVGIIMGANVGAAATPLILSLSSAGNGESFSVVGFLSAAMAVVGVIIYCFIKGSARRKNTGLIMIGFAVLMFGMEMMSSAVSGLSGDPTFVRILTLFSNPFMGILVGILVTAVIQSSGASIGILQALTTTGAVTNAMTIPILMGQNIGTCVSALISSVGATRDGKRTAIIHLSYNVMSALIWGSVYCVIYYFFRNGVIDTFLSGYSSALSVAIINLIYKLISVAVLMPLSGLFVRIANTIVRDSGQGSDVETLDERLLVTPPVAVHIASDVTGTMAGISFESFKMAMRVLKSYDKKPVEEIEGMEKDVDIYEDKLGSFLVKLSAKELDTADAQEVTKLLHGLSDIERISDHAVGLTASATEIHEKKLVFTETANRELETLCDAVSEILDMTTHALLLNDIKAASHVEPLDQVINRLCETVKLNHIRRLQNSECSIEHGFVLSDILTIMGRVADHCSNIAGSIIEVTHNSLGMHDYTERVHKSEEDYNAYFAMYAAKYKLDPTHERDPESGEPVASVN